MLPPFAKRLAAITAAAAPIPEAQALEAIAGSALSLELAPVARGGDPVAEAETAGAVLGLLGAQTARPSLALAKALPGDVLGRFRRVPQPLRLKTKAIREPEALTPDEVLHRTMSSKNHQHQLNARSMPEREAFMAGFKQKWVGDRPYVRCEIDLQKLDRRPFPLDEAKVVELMKAPPKRDGNYPLIAPNESASDHPHLILDGNHRVEAALRRGDTTMPAYVHGAIVADLQADKLTKALISLARLDEVGDRMYAERGEALKDLDREAFFKHKWAMTMHEQEPDIFPHPDAVAKSLTARRTAMNEISRMFGFNGQQGTILGDAFDRGAVGPKAMGFPALPHERVSDTFNRRLKIALGQWTPEMEAGQHWMAAIACCLNPGAMARFTEASYAANGPELSSDPAVACSQMITRLCGEVYAAIVWSHATATQENAGGPTPQELASAMRELDRPSLDMCPGLDGLGAGAGCALDSPSRFAKGMADVRAHMRHTQHGDVQVRAHTMRVDKAALVELLAKHAAVPDAPGLHAAIERALDQHHETGGRIKHIRHEGGEWRTSNTKPAASEGQPMLHVGGGKVKVSVGGELKGHAAIYHHDEAIAPEPVTPPVEPAPVAPAREKVGQGNTGDVHRDGDEVVKNARRGGIGDLTLEGEVYEKLKGVPGIAAGRQVGDEIRLPYYPQVLSIDTTVGENRAQYADLIRANAARINGAIAALSEAGYDYADPLQFGVKDGVMDLLDFSNVRAPSHPSSGVPRQDNRGLLGTFYSTFGCEDLARQVGAAEGALGQINRIIRTEEKTGLPSEFMRKVGDKTMGAHADRMKAELGGMATHSYAAKADPGKLPAGMTHFEGEDGTHNVLSVGPLTPEAIAKHGLMPVYHPPDARKPAGAHAGKTLAEHAPRVGDMITQTDDPSAPPARVIEVGKGHVKVVPDGMIDTFHVGADAYHTMGHTGENKGQLDWRERAPKPGLDKIGEGSGGPVFGDGKEAWKRPMGEEAAAYAAIAGTPGIAPAKPEADGWISMPHYPHFIHGLGPTAADQTAIKANAARIRGAFNALSSAGYSYGDTPQFGMRSDGQLDLLDLGNAKHVGVERATAHNERFMPATAPVAPAGATRIAPDRIEQDAGLAGLAFDKTMTAKHQEFHREKLASALGDLAGVLGLAPDMLGWRGKLSVSYVGMIKNDAMATYTSKTRTLTLRNDGHGSLAHEYAHFIDHVLAHADRGFDKPNERSFASGGDFSRGQLPMPVWKAMAGVMSAIMTDEHGRESKMLSSSDAMDRIDFAKRGADTYWGTSHELFARAFESHVAGKLKAAGKPNAYLVGQQFDPGGHYPAPKHAKRISAAFDQLFAAMQDYEVMRKAIWATSSGSELAAGSIGPMERLRAR